MSGRKNNLRQFQSIVNGAMGATTVTSPVTCLQWLDNIGIQLNFTGSPVGTFAVEVSADYAQDPNGQVQNAGQWISIPLTYLVTGTPVTATTVPTSVGSPIYLDLNQLSAPWIRLQYVGASGSGTLNAFLTAKML